LPARGCGAQASGVPPIASTVCSALLFGVPGVGSVPDAARSELVGIGRAWNDLGDIAVELTPYRSWTGSVRHEVTSGQLTVPYADAWLRDDA
jgi:hypothetical protein